MLGSTQNVDMVTSLKKNYGRVEVAVLNVDLILNMIDTVVIGDRLFSLPIQVEGRVANEDHEVQMDLDNGADGRSKSSEPNDRNSQVSQNNDKLEGPGHDNENRSGGKQGNASSKERTGAPVDGQMVAVNVFHLDKQTGNSALNFNQDNFVRDPYNQDHLNTADEASNTCVVEKNTSIKKVQQNSCSETRGEKDQTNVAQTGNNQRPCDLFFVTESDASSLNNSPLHAGHETKQRQQERPMIVASGSTVHGTMPCEMSLVADNLQNKSQFGNLSKNFNHGLHTEETALYINHVMTPSHVDKKDLMGRSKLRARS
jgi:hypothetical protein